MDNPVEREITIRYIELTEEERARDTAFRREMMRRDIAAQTDDAMLKGEKRGRRTGVRKGIRMGLKKGLKKGIETGRKEALQESALSFARNALRKGIPILDIVDMTGLSLETIEGLEATQSH